MRLIRLNHTGYGMKMYSRESTHLVKIVVKFILYGKYIHCKTDVNRREDKMKLEANELYYSVKMMLITDTTT